MCAYSGTTVVLLYSKLESVAQAVGLPCSALLRSPPPSRYIRVVGVYNSMNRSFHLVSFACLHTSRPFQLSTEGIIGEHTLSRPTIFVSQKNVLAVRKASLFCLFFQVQIMVYTISVHVHIQYTLIVLMPA